MHSPEEEGKSRSTLSRKLFFAVVVSTRKRPFDWIFSSVGHGAIVAHQKHITEASLQAPGW